MDCLFCKIAQGNIPAQIILNQDEVLAFSDINPQAPFHKIIIPKKHISTLNDLEEKDSNLVGQMILAGKTLAKELNLDEKGYRIVLNCNEGGGQTVFHIHAHLLGGRNMTWPPG